ncbi:hypothetical protein PG990_001805 [Apiospora arundinis]
MTMDIRQAPPAYLLTFTAAIITGAFLYRNLYYRRFIQNAHIPQLPPSLLWGHIKVFYDYTKQGKLDRHPDSIFLDMNRALGQPAIMLVDNWPVVPPMVVVASHHVAEQISKPSNTFPYSAPKSWSVDHIKPLIGHRSILLKQARDPFCVNRTSLIYRQYEEWKAIRRRYNPGFASQHLMTLLPVIMDKMTTYLENIDSFVRSGKTFSLDELTTNLTFDIIGAVSISEDMHAQRANQQGELIRMFKELIKTFADDKLQFPWWMAPLPYLRRRKLGQRISERLRDVVRRYFAAMKAREKDHEEPDKLRTIVALSLQGVDTLTPEVLEETCDQLKTFFFAGHDSTSAILDWNIYELFRTPRVLKGVRDELDSIFGENGARDPAIVCAKLLAPGGVELIHRMNCLEGGDAPAPASGLHSLGPHPVTTPDGGTYNLDGCWIYLNHNLIHRDRSVYGDSVDDFEPERWLLSSRADAPPVSSWRPFERGPRSCIGQELANIEIRVIVAMLAQRYEFTKVGVGELSTDHHGRPTLNDKGQFHVKSEMYNTIKITGKPVDGMMMKVKIASTLRVLLSRSS